MFNNTSWKQKASLMALGSIFTIIGMLFAIGFLPSVRAQKDKFGDIECTKLTVVDANGEAIVVLGVTEHGGFVAAHGKDGLLGVGLGIHEQGGTLSIFGKDGDSSVQLGIGKLGGSVIAYGKDSKTSAGLTIIEHGGGFSACGKNGKEMLTLRITEDGGHVQVRGKGEGAAIMEINGHGNGDVSTWDKNGYRQ